MADEPIQVLLIEGDPRDTRLIAEYLRQAWGARFEVHAVGWLRDGCERLSQGGIDVVLFDLSLPDGEGADTLEQLLAGAPDVPVVVLVGPNDEEVGCQPVAGGVQGHLLKGRFDGDMLVCSLRHAVKQGQARKALHDANEMLRAVIEASPLAIFTLDPDGRVGMWNTAAERIFGWPKDEVLGQPLPIVPSDKQGEFRALLERACRGERLAGVEVVRQRKDGTPIDISISTAPITDSTGQVRAVMAVITDITERKQAEAALRENARNLSVLMGNLPGMAYRCRDDPQWTMLFVSQGCLALTGYQPDDLIGNKRIAFAHLIHPDDREAVRREIRAALQQGKRYELTYRIITAEGQIKWVWERGCGVELPDGSRALEGFISDVTERIQAEEALARERDLLQTLMDNIPDRIYFKDPASRFIRINRAQAQTLGVAHPGDAIGKTDFDFFTPEHAQAAYRDEQAIVKTGQPLIDKIERVRQANGQYLWVSATKVPIFYADGQIAGLVGISRDISALKHAESAERQMRLLAEALRDTAAALTSTLDLDEVLDRILDSVGRVVPHDGANVMFIEEDVARVIRCRGYYTEHGLEEAVKTLSFAVTEVENLHQMARTGQPFLISDTRAYPGWVMTPQTEWVRSHLGAPIRLGEQAIGFLNLDSAAPNAFSPADAERLHAFAYQAAIAIQNARLYGELENYSSILKQAVYEATSELQDAKERVETILNNSPDAILLLRPDGTVERANSTFFATFGHTPGDIIGQSLLNLSERHQPQAIIEGLREVIEKREPRRVEHTVPRENGAHLDVDIAMAPICDADRLAGIVCSLRDITALKEVERMKDAFVSNVSHELRTPITSLKLNYRLIDMDPANQPIYMERLGREIDRLNTLIEDLLRLSRLDQGQVKLDLAPVDLNELAARYVGDRTPLAGNKGLSLSFNGAPGLPPVQADEGLLGQVLSVLLTNAINYTPPSGQITVTTHTREANGARWVGFRVRDTGPGIDPRDLPHLFERFFRGMVGRNSGIGGTGLGLSIAQEITARHGGHIEVASEGKPGQGAAFTVWLPAGASQPLVALDIYNTFQPREQHDESEHHPGG